MKVNAFIGSQTRWQHSPGKGIYSCDFNSATGELTQKTIFTAIENPTFLITSYNGAYLYAVIETNDFGGQASGGVAAFSIDPTDASLTLLNQRSSQGGHPCYLQLDRQGHYLMVANYTGGSVSVFPINTDGSLGEIAQHIQYQGHGIHATRQTQSHAHSVVVSLDNRYVFVQDLGVDKIYQYQLANNHLPLLENNPAVVLAMPGAGPRHLIFHPRLTVAYVINELNNTVTVYDYTMATGCLTQRQTIAALPADFFAENTAADIRITANGHFLYTSNRGHDSLAMFRIDQNNGTLTALGYQSVPGKHPRNFFITPDDKWLLCANKNTDNIASFKLNADTGQLSGFSISTFEKPTCITFVSH